MVPMLSQPAQEDLPVSYAVGIDVGSQSCSFCVLKPDKSVLIKPGNFANAAPGFAVLLEQLEQFQVSPSQILVGLEATSCDARKSLPMLAHPRLSTLSAPSGTNPPVCQATRAAR
jgi:hypothetical protein